MSYDNIINEINEDVITLVKNSFAKLNTIKQDEFIQRDKTKNKNLIFENINQILGKNTKLRVKKYYMDKYDLDTFKEIKEELLNMDSEDETCNDEVYLKLYERIR